MAFVTLGDHRGARVKAQLIGKKAKSVADVLDREGATAVGGGLIDDPQDSPEKRGDRDGMGPEGGVPTCSGPTTARAQTLSEGGACGWTTRAGAVR